MVKAGKTFIFRFPASEDLNRTLVRTGTYPDGNCFFHALLTAIDPKYRSQTSHYSHLKIVREFRRNLADWVTPEIFQSLGNGEQLKLHFLTALNGVLDHAFSEDYCTEPQDRAYHGVLIALVTRQQIDEQILPAVLKIQTENFYLAFSKEVLGYVQTKLRDCESTKVRAFCQWTHKFFVRLFEKAHDESLEKFKERLMRMGEFTDALQMECIARYVGFNFLFIREQEEDDSYASYPGLEHVVSFDSSRQSLLFLWISQNHYEILGELEAKNMINRIFQSDDPLIGALHA